MDKYREYQYVLSEFTDYELALAYQEYMDDKGSTHFTAIFWEADSRGLFLTDLEDLLNVD